MKYILKYTGLLIFLLYCGLLLLFAVCANTVFASTTSGNIGIAVNQVVDDTSGGFTGEFEYKADLFDVDVDAHLNFGDIYRGKLTANLIFDFDPIGIRITSKNVGKGYELATLGRNQTLSAGGNFAIGDWDIDVGLGGKNAAPWGAPNLLNDALPLGYDEGTLESINAANITPAPRGLPPREVSALLLTGGTNFEKGAIEGDIRLQLELTGEDKGHEATLYLQTSRDLGTINLTLAYEYGILYWQEKLHAESALLMNANFPF